MSSIFRKLSVVLCCLFGLISINPVTLAKPGDYLVYFFGRNYNPESFPKCGKCKENLLYRAGQFCCLGHCSACSVQNISLCERSFAYRQCACGNYYVPCECGNGIVDSVGPSPAFCYLKQCGPFCFIKHENGGNIDTVFENAKKSNQLYCAYCMAKELNGNFNGRVSSNVPSKVDYEIPDDVRIRGFFKGKTCTAELNEAFKLGNHIPDGDSKCMHCLRRPSPYTEIESTMAAVSMGIYWI